MKVTNTIQLQYDEKLAVEKVLGICDEIAYLTHCTPKDVFDYLLAEAEMVDINTYNISNFLQVSEIGK